MNALVLHLAIFAKFAALAIIFAWAIQKPREHADQAEELLHQPSA